jgi:hypothetical protein
MGENGEEFADLCGLNNLTIDGNIFAHKRIYQASCVSHGNFTENKIDNIYNSTTFGRSLQVKREDAATDHHLLTAGSSLS